MTERDLPEFAVPEAYEFAVPQHPRPIVILGAGGIVRDAHLPAYRKYGFPVVGIVDRVLDKAKALGGEYGITGAYDSVESAVAAAPADAVYDLALMPEHFEDALEAIPDGAAVLIQKPLGHDLAAAEHLVGICRRKRLVAAVNVQLRFAPYVEVVRRRIAAGEIGELVDLEVHINVKTDWNLFPAVLTLDRLELNMHSVHYLDLIRSFLGDPTDVMAVTLPHPERTYANSRSTILLRYGDRPIRVVVSTNHEHDFGPEHEAGFIKWEGTRGAARVQMGVLLDYPRGREDLVQIVQHERLTDGWRTIEVEGSWFPDAFAGSMGALQRFLSGEVPTLPSSVEDVLHTMAVVEAGHESSDAGGVRPRYPREQP